MTDQTKTDNKYDFKLEYTLVAQTPLIHFQPKQTGATLRATEVKPKLDRYLLQCAGKDPEVREQLDLWSNLVSANEDKLLRTFHYKMRIEGLNNPDDSQITLDDCKFYFGNQGDGDKKELVFNNCKLEIICFIPELLKFIDRHIGAFFALHNFGTRQTKGFGGFRIDGQTNEEIEVTVKSSGRLYFYADMPKGDQNSVKNRFNHALTVYSVMKNGLNMTRYNGKEYDHPDRYIKGFAMRPYFDMVKKETTGSDKAFIKSAIFPSEYDEPEDFDYEEFSFIRAIFGLAEQYEFRDDMRNNGTGVNPKNNKTFYHPVGVTLINCPQNEDGSPKIIPDQRMDDLKKEAEIQRFASPVTIKIYKHRIYFLFDDSYKQMLDHVFLFLAFSKEGKRVKYESIESCLSNGHYLSTPKAFNMESFLKNFVSYYNNSAREKLKEFGYPYKNSCNLTLVKGGEKNGNK